MAHHKGGGSSKNGRDSNSQRLGIKIFGGGIVGIAQQTCGHLLYAHSPTNSCENVFLI